jgi:hypothetical protein
MEIEDAKPSARALSCVVALLVGGCRPEATGSRDGWLARHPDQRVAQLERQLRGFDVAMLETGHRYVELYWAGADANWEAARYQVEKIRLAIENGLERRPKRTASARLFLEGPLAAMEQAISAEDAGRFETGFVELTAACNTCHAMEGVAHFEVRQPLVRLSPIRRDGSS